MKNPYGSVAKQNINTNYNFLPSCDGLGDEVVLVAFGVGGVVRRAHVQVAQRTQPTARHFSF